MTETHNQADAMDHLTEGSSIPDLHSSEKLCAMCSTVAPKCCSRCKCIRYCSKICQKADFPVHKLLCESFATLGERPNPQTKRAIWFPVSGLTPQWVWMPYDEIEEEGEVADINAYHDESTHFSYINQFERSNVLGRDLKHRLVIISGNYTIDLMPNPGIIAATQGLSQGSWRGSHIVYGESPKDGLYQLADIDLTDFRHVADWFSVYHNSLIPLPMVMVLSYPPRRIHGVRMNSALGNVINNVRKYQALLVSVNHPLFWNQVSSPISKLLGIEIVVSKIPFERTSVREIGGSLAMPLMLCCNPESEKGWGRPYKGWREGTGTVFLVRRDKKPLLPQHVEALICFCKFRLKLYFDESRGDSSSTRMTREQVLAEITPPKFSAFFVQYRALKAAKNPKWANVPSPYEV